MRDLKFRAWDTLKKVMIAEGFHVIGEVTMFGEIDNYCLNNHEGKSALDRYGDIEIMQYTGLKDKNGKEIYEGDIYLAHRSYMPGRWHKRKGYPDRITVICVVEWSIYNAGWEPKEISPIKEHIEFEKNCPYYYYNTSLMGAQDGNADWIEVIGNIYENPELITQTN